MYDETRRQGDAMPPARPQSGVGPKPGIYRWGAPQGRIEDTYHEPLQPLAGRAVGRHDEPRGPQEAQRAQAAHPTTPGAARPRTAAPSREAQHRLIERWKWRATAMAGIAFAAFWFLAFGHPVGSAAQSAPTGNVPGAQPVDGGQPGTGAQGADPYFSNGNANNNAGNGGFFGGFGGLGGGSGQGPVFNGRSS